MGTDLNDSFDKIASVGMFEHVGRSRLERYFKKVYSLLNRSGLFLNRGVVRPWAVSDGPETLFLQKYVFPGGDLVHVDDVVREGESAGFTVIGMEDVPEALCSDMPGLGKKLAAARGKLPLSSRRSHVQNLAALFSRLSRGFRGQAYECGRGFVSEGMLDLATMAQAVKFEFGFDAFALVAQSFRFAFRIDKRSCLTRTTNGGHFGCRNGEFNS
jgi:Mycolic acid cyclopropane synthetase